jgi:phage shock protein E
VIAAGGDDLVVLDIRTPEEFAEGHIDGSVNIDFYAPDFGDRLAELDPDARYVLYCRSDNRSGQTMPALEELGFATWLSSTGVWSPGPRRARTRTLTR